MKLLSITQQRIDTTSFFRANGVFGPLQKTIHLQIDNYDIGTLPEITWAEFVKYDAVFMQRPYGGTEVAIAAYIKQMGIPLWVDYDDNLFEVPVSNRSHELFSNKQVLDTMAQIIALADVVTVSTEPLQQSLMRFNNNVQIIPNAFNDYLFARRKFEPRANIALWRGSDSHFDDIKCVETQLNTLHNQYSDINFVYFGFRPFFLPETPNQHHIKAIDPIMYFKQLTEIKPVLMHMPLVPSVFNACKSNIAYLEATYAGAVCIAPNLPEWKNLPGALIYDTPDEYYQHITNVLNGKVDIEKHNTLAWRHIEKNLMLSQVNKLREKLLTNLIKK